MDRDFGFCNIKNGFIEESTGKLKFDPGDYGWSHRSITDQDYEEHLNGETAVNGEHVNGEAKVEEQLQDLEDGECEACTI